MTSSEGDGGKYVAELLAKFVDLRFKDVKSTVASGTAGVESSHTNDLEPFQLEVLELFRHVHSKDIFEAFYRRDLAKRLMLNKSTSIDAERSFVSKLKAECGAGYTSKMEGMFKDIDLSKDVMNMYQSYSVGNRALLSDGNSSVDMEVQVLTTGYWPMYPQSASIILPTSLKKHKDHFESYYNNKYQGRRLAWQHSLGSCIVRANFPKVGMRELVVSLPQALVLLCFNDEPTAKPSGLTITDIMNMTGLDDRSDTERVLLSLSLGRDGTRVLTKIDVDSDENLASSPASKAAKMKRVRRTVSDQDIFVFNASFSSNQHRIKITNIQVKETSEEREKTHEAVSQDRLYLIDAAIVRIMKARKSMDHRTLVGEVMTQIKFPAISADIKKRIESLIEREYLERLEDDHAQYKYLA
jgi:cullin-4